MPVAAPADRRFRRARVTPPRRSPWRRRALVVSLAAVVAAVVFAGGVAVAAAAARSPLLTIDQVVVRGNVRVATGEIHARLDGLAGQNLLTVDLGAWRVRLLDSPWIADVDMRRVFPRTVVVVVVEREPAAIARVGAVLHLVDRDGAIVGMVGAKRAALDLPIVDGLAHVRDGAVIVDPARARLTSRLLADIAADPALAAGVSEIDVTDADDAAVVLKGDTAVVRIGDDRFAERLSAYIELAPYLRDHVADIDSVDLRYGSQVFVRPRTEGSRNGSGGRKS